MNKEFIPYEQSLALKELGFDEPCFGYYYTTNGKDWQFAEKSEYYRLDDEINIGSKFSLLVPTFSQAFRWFREKYNLKGFVSPVEYLDGTDDTYHWCIYNECNSGYDQLTHEEAELACLVKLIEITNKTKYFSSDVPTYYN
jgi:hypothetical protein